MAEMMSKRPTAPSRQAAPVPPARQAAPVPPARQAAPVPPARQAAPVPPARQAAPVPPARQAAPVPPARQAAPVPPARTAAPAVPSRATTNAGPAVPARGGGGRPTPPPRNAAEPEETKAYDRQVPVPPSRGNAVAAPPPVAARSGGAGGNGRVRSARLRRSIESAAGTVGSGASGWSVKKTADGVACTFTASSHASNTCFHSPVNCIITCTHIQYAPLEVLCDPTAFAHVCIGIWASFDPKAAS